jgi:hypothetical protein
MIRNADDDDDDDKAVGCNATVAITLIFVIFIMTAGAAYKTIRIQTLDLRRAN